MKKVYLALFFLLSFHSIAQDIKSKAETWVNSLENSPQGPVLECSDEQSGGRIIPITKNAGSCGRPFREVGVGEYRLMRQESEFRAGDYLLTRPTPNKYQAILNLEFNKGNKDISDAEVQEVKERTRTCLQQMSPYFKAGNKSFEILFVSSRNEMPQGMPLPNVNRIKVTREDADYRGDASNFGTNFNCTTIGHEILHHLGLCDEYHEGVFYNAQGNQTDDWSCRSVTAVPSYMRSINYSFDSVVPQTTTCECNDVCQNIMKNSSAKKIFLSMNGDEYIGFESSLIPPEPSPSNPGLCTKSEEVHLGWDKPLPEKAFELASENNNVFEFNSYRASASQNSVGVHKRVYTCTCPPGHPFCLKMMNQLKMRVQQPSLRSNCPNSFNELGNRIGENEGNSNVNCDSGKCILTIQNPGNGGSLLRANHVAKVLAGNCDGGAPNYELCERYARMGAGGACNNKPAQCNDDNFYLGSE